MGLDEWLCHRRRQLRRWERLGHPIDTLSFVLCLVSLLTMFPTQGHRFVYGVLCLISCLCVTKDEWEHRELCSGFENWLHALLFMIHPILLIWAGWLWWQQAEHFVFVVGSAAVFSAGFGIYQMVYWNWIRHD